jgi:hypothetical protein
MLLSPVHIILEESLAFRLIAENFSIPVIAQELVGACILKSGEHSSIVIKTLLEKPEG